MISCRDLTCRFGAKVAVQNVSFELVDGAICALPGPNGDGKSTTLATLCGLISPSEAEAWVANVEVAPGSIELRRSIVAVTVRQRGNGYPPSDRHTSNETPS